MSAPRRRPKLTQKIRAKLVRLFNRGHLHTTRTGYDLLTCYTPEEQAAFLRWRADQSRCYLLRLRQNLWNEAGKVVADPGDIVQVRAQTNARGLVPYAGNKPHTWGASSLDRLLEAGALELIWPDEVESPVITLNHLETRQRMRLVLRSEGYQLLTYGRPSGWNPTQGPYRRYPEGGAVVVHSSGWAAACHEWTTRADNEGEALRRLAVHLGLL